RRASSIASLMTERPGAVRMSAAAPRAASVAPDTAVPQSACFNAGASLTPSPVIATRWPRACSALTMAYLCSDGVGDPGRDVVGIHVLRKGFGGRDDVRAHAELTRGLDRDRGVVAGHHLDPHALFVRHLDRGLGIVARRVEHRQYTEQRPALPRVLGTG